jgi:hypothetical protein
VDIKKKDKLNCIRRAFAKEVNDAVILSAEGSRFWKQGLLSAYFYRENGNEIATCSCGSSSN